ncbi:prolyl oligopeptidase family serine peptidase [Ornithinibacillus sp. 4-3]|uniref:Prolyl oligopeptidase family serine peptidase n=1 Tax=Ornithinibacillus sp. 4-3 TaxID=3231488 RepID=A0AB39HPT6_9BACI
MRTVTQKDLFRFQWPDNPKLSPNGEKVVYEVTYPREKENDNKAELWLADVNGDNKQVIAAEGTWNVNPVWSPDGKEIAFISNQKEGTQVWVYSCEDGTSRQLTHFHFNPSSLTYGAGGKTLYALLPIQEEVRLWNDATSADELTKNPSHRTYDTLYYKFDGVGFNNGTKKQIITVDVESADYKVVTDGSVNIEEYTVSPDEKSIVFTTIDFEDDNPLFNGSLYKVATTGGKAERIFDAAKTASPSYSPDGKTIAFIVGKEHQELYVIPAEGGEAVNLADGHPGTLADMLYTDSRHHKAGWKPAWCAESKHIYVLSGHQGTNEIVRYTVDKTEEAITVIGGGRVVGSFDYDGKDKIVFSYLAPSTIGRISYVQIDKAQGIVRKQRAFTEDLVENLDYFPTGETYVDDRNAEFMSEIEVVEPETYTYESATGWKIHGFMIKPANFEEGKKYPVVLDIHGGPHSTHGFTYFHQMQLYSAAGYAVIYVNPRGSSGYGAEFTKAVIGNYGTTDMEDIINGVDAAIAKYDFLDETRVAVTGLSYGGYMTNWIVTHTDRFQVAISEGGICNWVSMNGTSDIAPGFVEVEFAGKTSMDELWDASPLKYVDKVNTPILIVHSEDDLRVPMEQGEQFYSFIKRQNKDARFVRIPESSHVVLQNGIPDKKLARLSAMVDWLQAYLPTK